MCSLSESRLNRFAIAKRKVEPDIAGDVVVDDPSAGSICVGRLGYGRQRVDADEDEFGGAASRAAVALCGDRRDCLTDVAHMSDANTHREAFSIGVPCGSSGSACGG